MRKKKLPPIPKVVHFPTGKVTVKRKKKLMDEHKAFGMFHWHKREIWLDSELSHEAALLTLEHEKVHVVMMDAGIQLPEEIEERIADTFAAARVAELTR